MDISVKVGVVKIGHAVYKKLNGEVGNIDSVNSGPPVWVASHPEVCSMEVAADGMTATITALAPGDCHFEATADGDLSVGGVRNVVAAGNIHVEEEEVETGEIEFTDPA